MTSTMHRGGLARTAGERASLPEQPRATPAFSWVVAAAGIAGGTFLLVRGDAFFGVVLTTAASYRLAYLVNRRQHRQRRRRDRAERLVAHQLRSALRAPTTAELDVSPIGIAPNAGYMDPPSIC